MVALWRTDPRLAMAIDALPPEGVAGVEGTKDGHFTVRVSAKGSSEGPAGMGREVGAGVYLHSRYRPVQEAESWAEAQKCEGRYAVVVCGFGLGYHVKALFERLPEDALLVVAEPNLGVIKAALGVVELAELLGSGRVMIFTTLDRGNLVDRLEPRSVLFTAGAGTLLASHPASVQVEGGFHRAFQKLFTEFVAFTRTGFLTLMLNNVTTCRNIANNLGRYATTPPLDLLRDAYKGRPAVLVAAGPSLAKNMHLLKELVEH
jgi:hypothetical protein